MGSAMTLETVRDKLRAAGRFMVYNPGETVWAEDLADAIDAHLADKAGARADGELVCYGGQDCGCMGATVGQQCASAIPDEFLKIIKKLKRFEECAEDGEGADIGRPWFDALTFLGLLNRVQRSPAVWEMTDAGERAIAFGDLICAP